MPSNENIHDLNVKSQICANIILHCILHTILNITTLCLKKTSPTFLA